MASISHMTLAQSLEETTASEEELFVKAFASKQPLTIGGWGKNAIPLSCLQQLEKYVAGWKEQGLPRKEMTPCFSNPLVREAINGGLLLDQAEVALLQEAWRKILRRDKKTQVFIARSLTTTAEG